MRRRRQGVSVKCKSALAKFVVAERNALPSATTQKIWRRSLVGYSGRFIPGRSLVRIWPPLPDNTRSNPIYIVGYKPTQIRPLGQAVKTSPFHGGNMGSNPVGVTKQVKGEPVSIRRRIRLYHILQKDLLNKKTACESLSHTPFLFCYHRFSNTAILSPMY